MLSKFHLNGYWWLPDQPADKKPGTLTFSPQQGAVLQLFELFDSQKDVPALCEPPAIQGQVDGSKSATLTKCHQTGILSASFRSEAVFLGRWYINENEAVFQKLELQLSHLDTWISNWSFEIQPFGDPITVSYHAPQPLILARFPDYEISLEMIGNCSVKKPFGASISQGAIISINSSIARTFRQYLEIINDVEKFLALAIGEPVYPLRVVADSSVEIVYKLKNIPSLESPGVYEMLFCFGDVASKIELVLSNWINKKEILRPIYEQYMSRKYNPEMYWEDEFLNLVTGIEAYHRKTVGGKYEPDEEYRSGLYKILVDALPENLDNAFRTKLRNSLIYSNEYSFRKRLEDLLKLHAATLEKFQTALSELPSKVTDTRNFFVHLDDSLKDKAAKGKALYDLINKLDLLLAVCLLQEIGFSPEETKKLLERNFRIRQDFGLD